MVVDLTFGLLTQKSHRKKIHRQFVCRTNFKVEAPVTSCGRRPQNPAELWKILVPSSTFRNSDLISLRSEMTRVRFFKNFPGGSNMQQILRITGHSLLISFEFPSLQFCTSCHTACLQAWSFFPQRWVLRPVATKDDIVPPSFLLLLKGQMLSLLGPFKL